MLESIKNFPKQFSYNPKIENNKYYRKSKKFIILGMGGSHLAADLLQISNPELNLIIHKDYDLPILSKKELKKYLIIANSYSGNTEEVLTGAKKAIKEKLNLLIISTGGKLIKLAKNNNIPYIDAGIEQTWEFAHPKNKTFTGPLKKFKQMIYSDNYKILISHVSTKAEKIEETSNRLVFKVYVLSKDKKKYYYIWQIEKVKIEGKFKDCWMTTGVSSPIYLGDVI